MVVVDEYLINLIHYDFGNVTDAWPYLERICMFKFVIINYNVWRFEIRRLLRLD